MKKSLPYIISILLFIIADILFVVGTELFMSIDSIVNIGPTDVTVGQNDYLFYISCSLVILGMILMLCFYYYFISNLKYTNPKYNLGFLVVHIVNSLLIACLDIVLLININFNAFSYLVIAEVIELVVLSGLLTYKYLFTKTFRDKIDTESKKKQSK